jgi:integrase
MGERRGPKGEGWVSERSDGRCEAGLPVPDPVTGKTKYLRTTKKTKDEAYAWLATKKHERNTGTLLDFEAEKLTLSDYLERWLKFTVKHEVGPLTFINHEWAIRVHISPALGKRKLSKLTPAHVQGLYAEKLETGMSPGTVGNIHKTLRKALDQARRWRLVAYNAAGEVKPPRYQPGEMDILSREEVGRFFEAARDTGDRLEALWHLALKTGMREGEMLGLRWRSVDLERGIVSIRESATVRGEVRFAPPKGGQERAIEIGSGLIELLEDHRRAQRLERMRTWNWQDRGLVFPGPTGDVLRRQSLVQRFVKLLRRAGVRRVRIHDLRHTAATHMLEAGEELFVVSKTLGHASIKQTADTYAHVTPALRRRLASRMDAMYE